MTPPSMSTAVVATVEEADRPRLATEAHAAASVTPDVGALGAAGAVWGVGGHVVLLAVAVVQLSRAALRGLAEGLAPWQWGVAAATVVTLCFFQGYRGFQRKFSRLVVARASHLARHPRRVDALLAPLYCMGLFHATRRRRMASAALVVIMIALAFAVGRLPEPYHAIVDLGVACGLLWGGLSMVAFAAGSLAGRPPAISLDLPASSPETR
jgi:hypothetical protein